MLREMPYGHVWHTDTQGGVSYGKLLWGFGISASA